MTAGGFKSRFSYSKFSNNVSESDDKDSLKNSQGYSIEELGDAIAKAFCVDRNHPRTLKKNFPEHTDTNELKTKCTDSVQESIENKSATVQNNYDLQANTDSQNLPEKGKNKFIQSTIRGKGGCFGD